MSRIINFPTEHLPGAIVTHRTPPEREQVIRALQESIKLIEDTVEARFREIDVMQGKCEELRNIMEKLACGQAA